MGFPPFMGDVRDSRLGSDGGDTRRSCAPPGCGRGPAGCTPPPKDQLAEVDTSILGSSKP